MRRSLLAAFLIAIPAVACAQAPAADHHAHHAAMHESGLTTLRLGENAQRALRQDRLTIQLRAEVTGPNATQVQAEINRRIGAALTRARAVQNVRAETGGYWVNQERPQNSPVRWRGVQSLTLTGTDTAAMLALAGELQQADLVMSALNFDLAPATARSVEDELTTEALRRLRERADRVASAMGLTIRSFREIRLGNVGGNVPQPRPMLMRAEAMAAASAAPPSAEPGETTVQISVEADVVLGPAARP